MSRRIAPRRGGVTLLEMIMVIAMATTVALVAVRLLDAVLRVQHAAHSRAHAAAELTRLADSLRRDARQARGVQIEGGNIEFQIGAAETGNGERIRYGISGSQMRRQVTQGDATIARDSFALVATAGRGDGRREPLARQSPATWQWEPEIGVLALQLQSAAGRQQEGIPLRIEAVVGGGRRSGTPEEVTP